MRHRISFLFRIVIYRWKHGENGIISGDMTSSVRIGNKGRDILLLGEEPTQGINDTTLTAKDIYPNNFTQPNN